MSDEELLLSGDPEGMQTSSAQMARQNEYPVRNSILVILDKMTDGYKVTVEGGEQRVSSDEIIFPFDGRHRLSDVIANIEVGECKLDDFRDVGSELYESIFFKAAGELFAELRSKTPKEEIFIVRLRVPAALQQLPWEALYDERHDGFLCTHPRYCVLRQPLEDTDRDQKLPIARLPVTLLAVIPEGSGLNVEQEWHNLRNVVERYPNLILIDRLDGRVTPERLSERLEQVSYNIVHFIGHGEVNSDNTFTIRLNDPHGGEDFWMDSETFANSFYKRPPQLVILNCCLGAAASPKRSLTGIAPAVLRSEVSAVVAMRYEIADDVAIEFTSAFYRELLSGDRPGRVDSAISRSRQSIYRNKRDSTLRGFITPVLYLRHSQEHLFRLPRVPDPIRDSDKVGVREPIPQELRACVEKLKARDCIAVVGPGILGAHGLTRSNRTPPSIRELAERLAAESDYPWLSEFPTDKAAEDWMAGLLLPWVCQHYQKTNRRYALIKSIEEAYKGVDPPSLARVLARLNLPAMVYTHFDGVVEAAVMEANRTVEVMASVDQKYDADSVGTVFLCPKGTLRLKHSLVLTEEDHEKLYERLAQFSPVLRDRMRGQDNRCALFIGVSPRDELVRRLAAQLLEAGDNRMQGPTFFICEYHSAGDDAYWAKYDVRWIACPTEDFAEIVHREAL